MKILYPAFIAFLFVSSSIFAQSHFTHTATSVSQHSVTPAGARDFWFAVPQNNDPNDDAGKVFTIYASSNISALVNIQMAGQAAVKKQIAPGEVWNYELPRSVELKSNGVIEQSKAVHVWCDNADISVYFLSRNPYTSDGFMVIPTLFLDTSYVVASYSALVVDPRFDLPSEFCIVANQNNTLVTITPSKDIRKAGEVTMVQYPKGVPFTVTLQQGECVQYQTVFDLGGSDLDLTGTIVTSNRPIGVIGASVCPFIPADPYCDHICEMLLPVSKWGRTYHTIPFAGRKPPGGDGFYLIGSMPGQTIYRNGVAYVTINRFEKYFGEDINEASAWTSSAPFMLVQYINSATYGVPSGGSRNLGDPAMVEINPAEFARTQFTIQTPYIAPGSPQNPFTNYVNILVPTSAVPSLRFDGTLITTYPNIKRLPISGTAWEGIQLKGVTIGAHQVTCDSAVTAYAYGYATDDSYAWSVLGPAVPVVPIKDSIPPAYTADDRCTCTMIELSDIHPNASKIVSIEAGTVENLTLTISPSFVQGKPSSDAWYVLCATAGTTGSATVVVTDSLGNSTTIRSNYIPHFTEGPADIQFTVGANTLKDTTITITNLTDDTLRFISLGFAVGEHFSMGSSSGFPIRPHRSVSIFIRFLGSDTTRSDTLLHSVDSCELSRIPLTATILPSGAVRDDMDVHFKVNPVVKDRMLVIGQHSPTASTVEVYDIVGKLVLTRSLPPTTELVTEEIRLPNSMIPGSYIVRYSTRGYLRSQVVQVVE